jgi:hypothetical protein
LISQNILWFIVFTFFLWTQFRSIFSSISVTTVLHSMHIGSFKYYFTVYSRCT